MSLSKVMNGRRERRQYLEILVSWFSALYHRSQFCMTPSRQTSLLKSNYYNHTGWDVLRSTFLFTALALDTWLPWDVPGYEAAHLSLKDTDLKRIVKSIDNYSRRQCMRWEKEACYFCSGWRRKRMRLHKTHRLIKVLPQALNPDCHWSLLMQTAVIGSRRLSSRLLPSTWKNGA